MDAVNFIPIAALLIMYSLANLQKRAQMLIVSPRRRLPLDIAHHTAQIHSQTPLLAPGQAKLPQTGKTGLQNQDKLCLPLASLPQPYPRLLAKTDQRL